MARYGSGNERSVATKPSQLLQLFTTVHRIYTILDMHVAMSQLASPVPPNLPICER